MALVISSGYSSILFGIDPEVMWRESYAPGFLDIMEEIRHCGAWCTLVLIMSSFLPIELEC